MATLFDIEATADFSSTVVSDGTISDSGSQIAIAITSASTAARYGVKTFTSVSTNHFRCRWYWTRNTLDGNNLSNHRVFEVWSPTSATRKFEVRIQDNPTDFALRLSLFNDADSEANSGAYVDLTATWPEYVEIWIQKASNGTGANDARADIYFAGSGTPAASVTGVDLFDDFNFDEIRIGHVALVDADLTGTMLLDHIKGTDTATEIGAASSPPAGTVPANGTCINIYGTTAVSGMAVTDGSSPITSVTVSCTSGGLMTFDTTGTSVSLSGNGTNSVVMTLGADATEYTTVLDTLLMQGTTVDTQLTITLAPTDGTLSDSDQFTVLCDPAAFTFSGTNANMITAAATFSMRLLPGQTHDTISVNVVDDTGGTPLEADSSFVAGLASYFAVETNSDDALIASTRGITDVIM